MKTRSIESLRGALPKREHRFFESAVELRAAEGAPPKIGMTIPFGRRSEELWGFVEVIDPHAFDETLKRAGCDIVALWNHDTAMVLGRQSNKTFEVKATGTALEGVVELDPEDEWHRAFARRVARRDVIGSSFGFETIRDRWEENREDDTVVRTLLEVRLFEMSPVTFPAYPDSQAEERTLRTLRRVAPDPTEFLSILEATQDGKVADRHVESVRRYIDRLQGMLPAPAAPAAVPVSVRERELIQRARQLNLT